MTPLPSGRDRVLTAARRAAPRPHIEETTAVRVRFQEVDSLQIVWHGHYVTYFEEARRGFGRRFGLDYPVFMEHEVAAPIVQIRIDYLAPARLPDTLDVTARLFKSESAKLEFEFEIRRQGEGRLLATGSSLQVFTTPAGELLLQWPPLMVERYKQWEPLWIHP